NIGIILDDPTSEHETLTAKDLIIMLERLNKEIGITIIMVEHRLEEIFHIADRVLLLNDGEINYQGRSRNLIYQLFSLEDKQFTPYIPAISQLYLKKACYPKIEDIPLTVKETREWLASLPTSLNQHNLHLKSNTEYERKPIIELKDIYYQYDKGSPLILKKLSLQINQGDYYAIVGGNGSGKTTLLKACLGMLKLQRGKVYLMGEN